MRASTPEPKLVGKSKSKASITPNTFRRFFAPRRQARHVLGDLTFSSLNSLAHADESPGSSSPISTADSISRSYTRRRKSFSDNEFGIASTPCKRQKTLDLTPSSYRRSVQQHEIIRPVVRSRARGALGDLLSRELHRGAAPGQKVERTCSTGKPTTVFTWSSMVADSIDSRLETNPLCSGSEDIYKCQQLSSDGSAKSLPFCAAACHSKF